MKLRGQVRTLLWATILAVPVIGAGLVFYTCRIEPHWVKIERRALPVEHLPETLNGASAMLLADFHVGEEVSEKYLVPTLRKARLLKPDFLFLGGDFVSYSSPENFGPLRRVLKELPLGRRGSVAILGNHDYGHGWRQSEVADRVAKELTNAGVTVLRNSSCEIDGLRIVGMDDLWAERFKPSEALKDWQAEGAALVLCHNPDALDKAGWGEYRGWILAGHTHGGQCRPPFLAPPILPVSNRRYAAGEIDLGDGRRVYVNRGIGHLTQARFLARPEITLFTLEPAARDRPIGQTP